jgi:hypothetical protein
VPVCPEKSDLFVAVGDVSSLRHTLNVGEPATQQQHNIMACQSTVLSTPRGAFSTPPCCSFDRTIRCVTTSQRQCTCKSELKRYIEAKLRQLALVPRHLRLLCVYSQPVGPSSLVITPKKNIGIQGAYLMLGTCAGALQSSGSRLYVPASMPAE